MDVLGYILNKTYFKNKKCFFFVCVFFWGGGHKSIHCQRKNNNLEKNGTFKIKIFNVQWKIKIKGLMTE